MSARRRRRIWRRARRKAMWRRYLRGATVPTSFAVEVMGEDGVWRTVWSGDRASSPALVVPFAAYEFERAGEDA